VSKLVKFRKSHAERPAKSNPPLGTDLLEYIGPGFAAFAATRFLTRVVSTQIAKRWPRYAVHAGAVASVGTFGAAWFGAHRVSSLERYHHPIVVGAGIAALQSLIQLYLPALGWIVADASPQIAETTGAQQQQQVAQQQATGALPSGWREVDADAWFRYNDAHDSARQAPAAPNAPAAEPGGDAIDDLINGDDLTGIFAGSGS
jgi:hypothetical protein